jgi:hypothetical protein
MAARRRRNRTVHFGDNLFVSYPVAAVAAAAVALRDNNRNSRVNYNTSSSASGSASSLPGELLEPNVQQLFTFIENVLSAWDDRDNKRNKDVSVPTSSNSVPGTPKQLASKERRQQRLRRSQQHQRGVERIGADASMWSKTRRPLPLPPQVNGTPVYSRRIRREPEPKDPKALVMCRRNDPTGSKRYAHEHWPVTPDECNVAFLTKVILNFVILKYDQNHLYYLNKFNTR